MHVLIIGSSCCHLLPCSFPPLCLFPVLLPAAATFPPLCLFPLCYNQPCLPVWWRTRVSSRRCLWAGRQLTCCVLGHRHLIPCGRVLSARTPSTSLEWWAGCELQGGPFLEGRRVEHGLSKARDRAVPLLLVLNRQSGRGGGGEGRGSRVWWWWWCVCVGGGVHAGWDSTWD